MIELRPFKNLGKSDHGWLKANFHFSFADYHNRNRMHWGALRVWNNDRIAAGTGFDPHPHRDMEIVTYVMKGAITHQDSVGNEGRTEAGQIQVMSAGSGIVHAEYNREPGETELFQIWLLPNKQGVKPRWETRDFPAGARDGKLVPLASGFVSHDGQGAIPLYADGALYAATVRSGDSVSHTLDGRPAYLVPAKGAVKVNGVEVNARDGVAIEDVEEITIEATADAEIVLVETAPLH